MSLDEAFDIIELKDKSIIHKMNRTRNYEEACKTIQELREILKKQKRIIAKKYHPDVGGDEEKFKEVSDVLDKLFKIDVQKQQPIQSYTVIIRTASYESRTTNTTSSMWWSTF